MTLAADIDLSIYRDDLNHPTLSGNKLHKLAPYLQAAARLQTNTIVSFGGAYSNHLHALAWACKDRNLNSIGIVRGELHASLTPTLRDCQQWGMQLIPSNRATYRDCLQFVERSINEWPQPELFTKQLTPWFPELEPTALVVPEGGSSLAAIESLAAAYRPIFQRPEYAPVTHVFCATGTGATLAGLALAAPSHINVLGVQAVAEGQATHRRIKHWLGSRTPELDIIVGHLGGFAKTPPALKNFITKFETEHGVPLDPVYNAKVAFKIDELIAGGFFKANDHVLMLHTGGLQGIRGLSNG